MNLAHRLLESKVVVLLIIGILMLIVSRIIKRGRQAEELPSTFERLIWAGGILITVASLIYAGSRGCMVDVPKEDKKQLPEFSGESPGCSKSEKEMKSFRK